MRHARSSISASAALTVLATGLWLEPVQAADSTITSRKAGEKSLRTLRSEPKTGTIEAKALVVAEQPVDFSFTLGLAHDRGEDSLRVTTTPFNLDAAWGNWYLAIAGDGYARVTADGQRVSGLADVSVLGEYELKLGESVTVTPGVGWTFPTHGEVGSRRPSQDASLRWTYVPKDSRLGWAMLLGLHRDGEAHPGVSRYTQSGRLRAIYKPALRQSIMVEVGRSHTSANAGNASHTGLLGAYVFPISGSLDGAVTVGRGLSDGKRDTLVAFDLSVSF